MKRVFALLSVGAVSVALIGCGGGGAPTNVAEGVEQSEVDAYNAMLAADEAAMAEEQATGGTGEVEVPAEDGAAPE